MEQETVKLLNVLRRIARAAGYAAWNKSGPDATQFCVAQYNRVLTRLSELEPAAKQNEGERVELPKGFDAQRWRLTGNVAGEPPFRGTLRHHGWVARQVRLPAVSEALDPRILAPAEVELA